VEHGERQTSRSCRMAQKRMALQGVAEARSTHDQRLPGTVGPSQCGYVSNEFGTPWLGEITEFEQYRDLLDWATRSRNSGELLPLPKEFQRHLLNPFRKRDSRPALG
jgi:hypothetical protein